MRWIAIISILFFASCNNAVKWKSEEVDAGTVYFDYKIRGSEEDQRVTVYLEFKLGGPNGPSLVLGDSSKVELDGEELTVDSAKLTGAYYEVRKPLDSFIGRHAIVFTDLDQKTYREEFTFGSFRLKKPLPKAIDRGEIVIELDSVAPGDHIRLSATDTSFQTHDINEIDTVNNGKLLIPASKLNNLADGPITLLLSRETEKPVKNGTKAGGRIVLSYGLQREFELRSRAH